MKISPLELGVIIAFAPWITEAQSVTDDNAYKGCTRPDFNWATYSTRSTARTYGMKGAFSKGRIFAANFVKSTLDSADETEQPELFLTGPFSQADPGGGAATTLAVDLRSYREADGYSENAGGSFGQYEVGVAVLDAETGVPLDFFVYHGHGYDETSGMAASGNVLAISGHFTGNLTAVLGDGTSSTIWNSNVGEGGVPDPADQFHPNAKDSSAMTGVDDGFVIRASALTGAADWIVRYPISNRDAQVVGVALDADGNVFGAGHRCSTSDGAPKVCEGIVAKLAAIDGAVEWEAVLPELATALWIAHDPSDGALYVSGSTTYGGDEADARDHPHCNAGSCSVLLRLNATSGVTDWVRTVAGSPRWGVFDQSGGVVLAAPIDGPYVYVVFDDTPGDGSETSADAGTPYAGCLGADGAWIAETDLVWDRVATRDDCPMGYVFVTREDAAATAAADTNTGVTCGDGIRVDGCLMKYHKHTGLPIWAINVPPVAGLVAAPDGSAVHIAGWYYPDRWGAQMGDTILPGYLRKGGLGTQTSGIFNAKISTATGVGQYALHSGGGSKDRLYDLVGDPDGNLYNIGYSMNLVMNWGGTLKTTMQEQDITPEDAKSEAVGTHMYISKLMAARERTPLCMNECGGNIDDDVLIPDHCFIDGQCYTTGERGSMFGKSCFTCNPRVSEKEWTKDASYGTTQCYIDAVCVDAGDVPFYQRRTWSEKFLSECRVCDPQKNAEGWSVRDGYVANESAAPPNDCATKKEKEEGSVMDPSPEVLDNLVDSSVQSAPVSEQSQESGLSSGAITGITVAAVTLFLLIVAFVLRKKFTLAKKL